MKISPTFEPDAPAEMAWSAVDDSTYEPGQPVGRGPTAAAAIADLKEKFDERG